MFYIYPLVFPRGQTYAFAAEKAVNLYPFKTNRDLFFLFVSPQDSTTWIAPGFQLPGILVIYQWIFYSGFQNTRGRVQIPSAACIPNFTSPISRIPESGFPYMPTIC